MKSYKIVTLLLNDTDQNLQLIYDTREINWHQFLTVLITMTQTHWLCAKHYVET